MPSETAVCLGCSRVGCDGQCEQTARRLRPWLDFDAVQRFAPGACSCALWDDGSVAVLVWPDGGWQAWAPGVRAALGGPLAWGVEKGNDGVPDLDEARRQAVDAAVWWRDQGGER